MRCRKCGINNPDNVVQCLYCGSSFNKVKGYGKPKKTARNSEQRGSRPVLNHWSKMDKVIISVIVALAILVVTVFGVYISDSMPRRTGFSGGGGGGFSGGGGTISGGQPPTAINGPISMDEVDPEVEIYSFKSDLHSIPVGETKTVTFTAEIFANLELTDTDVIVVSNRGDRIGYMNDKGVDGDAVSGDGIYTLAIALRSDTRRGVVYQAKAKTTYSNGIEVYFYTPITQEEYAECTNILNKVEELNEANAIKEYLQGNPSVESVSIADQVVKYTLKSGITCVWDNTPIGELKGSSGIITEPFANFSDVRSLAAQADVRRLHGDGDVCVVRPFRSTDFKYDDFLHAGNILADVLDGRMNKYDDKNATLDVFKNFDEYGVVLIDSHGTLSGDPYILTGEKMGPIEKYSDADWQAERIILCSGLIRKTIAVGPKFFDTYYSDNSLNGSVFYLGSCYSMYNDTLADVLIKKGAEVVYGFSNVVSTYYCNDILKEFAINQFILNISDAKGAFDGSVQAHGGVDPHNNSQYNCRFKMKGANGFKLVTDKQYGQITGSVRDANTGNAIKNAVVRVYNTEGELINTLKTNAEGLYNAKVPEGDYIVRINSRRYKSAKVSVDVTANVTTYIETLLLFDAGVNEGFANGIITNAVSGDVVPAVSIKMRNGWNNKDGAVLHTTSTNENGYYEIQYRPGFYTIEYSKSEFITGYRNIIIGIVDFAAQNAAISPEMPDDGNFRIVLSWSEAPKDLDSHLTGPKADGGRFHLFFRYANTSSQSNSNSEYCQLDLDNTDIVVKPNIPETTTILTQLDGTYRYSVHDYTNKGNANSSALSRSNAVVNVYKGSVWVATYHVPPNVKGTIWTVFELNGNTITPVNKMGNGHEEDRSF